MAFVDDYSPINFVDLPNETTPIDAENLNKMDSQIKKLSTFASTTDPETTEDRLSGLEEKTNSLKEDLSNKITKFYASNQGGTHLADSDNGKIQDMVLYGKSEQNQYKGINLLPPDTNQSEYVEVSIPKGSHIFWATDGTPSTGGNFRFYNEDKTQDMWFGVDKNTTSKTITLSIDAKYVQNLLVQPFDSSKICLAVGSEPIYEPYTGGQPSPSPNYPQEIKSVVNPTVKLLGSNILKIRDGEYQNAGCTVTVSNGVIKLNGTSTDTKRIYLPIDTPSMLKEGTEIIFCPNNIGGTEHLNKCYVDYSNENTKGFSVALNTINTPYVITRQDARYEFKLSIKITRGNTFNNETWKPQILIGKQITPFEPYKEQSIQLPITLNAIPVSSDGNVTINGQQYIADYVDVENGKIVKCVEKLFLKQTRWGIAINKGVLRFYNRTNEALGIDGSKIIKNLFSISSHFAFVTNTPDRIGTFTVNADGTKANISFAFSTDTTITSDDFNNWILNNKPFVLLPVLKEELPLTSEQIQALKELATYYPVTDISVNSEQLDGYTVFNYPISMANGWNYVKQQLNDNRDYIYDMDTQSAEAYVNSEYAVALTELEV